MKKPKYADENPILKLHPGEPFFFIRAQDKLSVLAVAYYSRLLQEEADRAALTGDNELWKSLSEQSAQVAYFANRFMDWQELNPSKVKLPD